MKLEKEMLYQDIIRSAGKKRGPTSYTIFMLLKTLTVRLTYNYKYMVKNLKFNIYGLFIAMASVSYKSKQSKT